MANIGLRIKRSPPYDADHAGLLQVIKLTSIWPDRVHAAAIVTDLWYAAESTA